MFKKIDERMLYNVISFFDWWIDWSDSRVGSMQVGTG